MKREILCALAVCCLSSCAPAVLAPEVATAGLIQSMGSTANALFSSESSIRLNGANLRLAEAQTRVALAQAKASSLEARRLARERIVTSHLLAQMSRTYNDPLLAILGKWVAGGGDPDFAFKYALAQVHSPASQVRVIPSQPGLAKGHVSRSILPPIADSQSHQRPLAKKSARLNPQTIHVGPRPAQILPGA